VVFGFRVVGIRSSFNLKPGFRLELRRVLEREKVDKCLILQPYCFCGEWCFEEIVFINIKFITRI